MDSYYLLGLIVLFACKHYIADKLMQYSWMRGKTYIDFKWILPLTAHVLVHIIWSLFILIIIGRLDLLWLLLVEFVIHFTMDRIKSAPYLLGKFKGTKWNTPTIVLDQSVHTLNYVYMIIVIIGFENLKLYLTFLP